MGHLNNFGLDFIKIFTLFALDFIKVILIFALDFIKLINGVLQ